MRVLFVNADQELGFEASAALSRQACTVDWVRDGLSAMGLVVNQTYDLIVLDLNTLHHSDFGIEDLVPFGQSKLLLLNDLNRIFDEGRYPWGSGCTTQHINKPFTIAELLASITGFKSFDQFLPIGSRSVQDPALTNPASS